MAITMSRIKGEKMFEVCIGVILGALIVAVVFVGTFVVMFPFDFEVVKLFLEEIQIELEVKMMNILILVLEEKFK